MRIHTSIAWIALLTFLVSQYGYAESALPKGTKAKDLWFQPELVENNDAACEKILQDARDFYVSRESVFQHYFSSLPDKNPEVAGMKPFTDFPDRKVKGWQQEYLGVYSHANYGGAIYLGRFTTPVWGGAYEVSKYVTAKHPLPDDFKPLIKENSLPLTMTSQLYIDQDGSLWIYLIEQPAGSKDLQVYKLSSDASWILQCRVRLVPDNMQSSKDSRIRVAYQSLMEIKQSVYRMTQGAGSCGTMATHSRWSSEFAETLPQTLYRPWEMSEVSNDSTYEIVVVGLKDWSLTGLYEYESFNLYLVQLERTVKALSDFYQAKFGWTRAQSESMARTALTTVISGTISFYMYEPFPSAERELRRAILEHQPLGRIKKILQRQEVVSKEGEENILPVAVRYPEAFRLLLEKGIPVDHPNGFGKTALMYAIQSNEYESVRALLDAGADPNVKTIRPWDTCYYTLRTIGMTPLHYAVRYASPEIIRLLLDSGAFPSNAATGIPGYADREATPLDWLEQYTSDGAGEKNPNIPKERIAEVKSWLKENRFDSSRAASEYWTERAEQVYQWHKPVAALHMVRTALSYDPANERALSDLSLIALKTGALGESIDAGERLRKSSSSERYVANAWFNQGLACEKHILSGTVGSVSYKDRHYCNSGYVYAFYRAASIENTSARQEKLREIFNRPNEYCEIPAKGIKIIFQKGQDPDAEYRKDLQTLFVLHPSSAEISAEELSWPLEEQTSDKRGSDKLIIPKKIETIDMGENSLSLFSTSEAMVVFPYYAFGQLCTDKSTLH